MRPAVGSVPGAAGDLQAFPLLARDISWSGAYFYSNADAVPPVGCIVNVRIQLTLPGSGKFVGVVLCGEVVRVTSEGFAIVFLQSREHGEGDEGDPPADDSPRAA
jgi:hypothetical protein